MDKSTKTTLIVIGIILAIPFSCCGFPIACSNVFAPTTCRYMRAPAEGTPAFQDGEKLRGVGFFTHMVGPNDFNESYHLERGPRYVRVVPHRLNEDASVSVRLIEVSAISSRIGQMEVCTPKMLPYEFEFDTVGGTDTYASWEGNTLLMTDPHAGDIVTVTFTVDITRDEETTRHTFTYIQTPKCERDPYWWMPSV